MKHYIINIEWNNSEFTGSVSHEYGLTIAENISSPNFYEFIELAEGCIEVLNPCFLLPDGNYPEWYKNKEYDFSYNFKDMATLLKAYSSYVPLATLSKATHINKGLLSHYANGLKVPREKQRETIIKKLHEIGNRLCNINME